MRKYSQISVWIKEDILDLFLARVSELSAGRWRRDPAGEQQGIAYAALPGIRYVEYARVSGSPANVVFMHQVNVLKLINAFVGNKNLTHAEHGRITAAFWKAGMHQACQEFNVE